MGLAIFFDTNCFKNKDFLHDSQLEIIVAHAQKYGMRLLISRVVCLEIENQRDREVKYVKSFVSKWKRVLTDNMDGDDSIIVVNDFSPQEKIYEPLERYGFEILGNVEEDIYHAVNSFYKGWKPSKKIRSQDDFGASKRGDIREFDHSYIDYNYKDNIIKDVFIWRSVLPFLKSPECSGMAMITDNKDDFCDSVDRSKLHPELIVDVGSDRGEAVVVFESMEEFIRKHIDFLEKFEISLLEILLNEQGYHGFQNEEDVYPIEVKSCTITDVIDVYKFKAKAVVIYSDQKALHEEQITFLLTVSRDNNKDYDIEYDDTYGEGL